MFKQTKIRHAIGVALSSMAALSASPSAAQDTQRIEITGS